LSLVRNESFTKAGQDLAVSTATVTSQIKQLEDDLETRLLFRTTRSVKLTDAGAVLARQATKISHLIEAIPERLGAVANLERGKVSVGIIGTAGYVMPKVLASYQREHPGIHLDLMMGNRNTIGDGRVFWRAVSPSHPPPNCSGYQRRHQTVDFGGNRDFVIIR